jgi:hypothetical protein
VPRHGTVSLGWEGSFGATASTPDTRFTSTRWNDTSTDRTQSDEDCSHTSACQRLSFVFCQHNCPRGRREEASPDELDRRARGPDREWPAQASEDLRFRWRFRAVLAAVEVGAAMLDGRQLAAGQQGVRAEGS